MKYKKSDSNRLIEGNQLMTGDVFAYPSLNSKNIYIVAGEIKVGEQVTLNIPIVRENIQGKLEFYYQGGITIINKFNTKRKISRDWKNKVQLIASNQAVPLKEEILILPKVKKVKKQPIQRSE